MQNISYADKLSADVILSILEFYECPHYAPYYDKFETKESFNGLVRYFYGYFDNDPHRTIYPLFPAISMARFDDEYGCLRIGEVESVNPDKCFPKYVRNLQVCDGAVCEIEDFNLTCLESLLIGPLNEGSNDHLQKLVEKNPKLRKLVIESYVDDLTTHLIQSFHNLDELDLFVDCSYINITQFNEIVRACPNLRKLSVCIEEIVEEDGCIDISKHSNLEYLRFDSYTIDPCQFKMNDKLNYLLLQNMMLNAESSAQLFTSNQLKKLLIYHDCIDMTQIDTISQNTSLTKFTCDDQHLWKQVLPLIIDHPNINHLRMYLEDIPLSLLYATIFSGKSSMASRLRALKLQWLRDPIDDVFVSTLLRCCPLLNRLKLGSCVITSKATSMMKKSHINELTFSNCMGLTNETVIPLLSDFPALKHLNLDICSIEGNLIGDLIADNTTITSLIFNCDIGETQVKKILARNKTLERLVIEGTNVEFEWLEPLHDNHSLLWLGLSLKDKTWIDFYRSYSHIPHLMVTSGKEESPLSQTWQNLKHFYLNHRMGFIVHTAIAVALSIFAHHIYRVRK